MKQRSLPQRHFGLSMIEILVSLTIVAFGLLGLLGLQARALSFQKDSFDRRSAAEMVAQVAERMRSNHFGLTAGFYTLALDATDATPGVIRTCASAAACTFLELANKDLDQWSAELRRRIPSSAAYLQWNAANQHRVLVSVAWLEPQSNPAMNAAQADPLCTAINARLSVAIPLNYRCFETMIIP